MSFLLLFLIKGLIPSLDLCCELQKVPKLMEHFDEHRTCNDDSFIKFLLNEYIAGEADSRGHHDEADHENLPFNGSHQCCQLSVFVKSDPFFSLEEFEFTLLNEYGFRSHFYASEIIDSLFEPPKA